jgi:hypothetical protein
VFYVFFYSRDRRAQPVIPPATREARLSGAVRARGS